MSSRSETSGVDVVIMMCEVRRASNVKREAKNATPGNKEIGLFFITYYFYIAKQIFLAA